VALYRDRVNGVGWELGNSQVFALLSRIYLGQMARLAGEWPAAAEEASRRGDLHAAITLRSGHTSLVWLAADDPARAKANLAEAAELGRHSRWSTQHDYFDLFAWANLEIYEGTPAAACERLKAGWPGLEKSYLLKLQFVRVIMTELRGRAALAAGDLDAAARDAKRLLGEKPAWAHALGQMLSAAVTAGRGRLAPWKEAATQLDACGLKLHAACARRRAGSHDELLTTELRAPDKFLRLYCPTPPR
jgi:eukaryotic-like serine/threonine-protein kinase